MVGSRNCLGLCAQQQMKVTLFMHGRSGVPAWPQEISGRGKLRDARYGGCGWPLFFRNPDRPMAPVHKLDFTRVATHLQKHHDLEFRNIGEPTTAVMQMKLGVGKGQGNVHLYLSLFGRVGRNSRINGGTEERVREVRSVLLKSAWFADACGCGSKTEEQVAASVFQPGGAVVLPRLSIGSSDEDIMKVLTTVNNRLGKVGKEVMSKYLDQSELPSDSAAYQMLDDVFGMGKAESKPRGRTEPPQRKKSRNH